MTVGCFGLIITPQIAQRGAFVIPDTHVFGVGLQRAICRRQCLMVASQPDECTALADQGVRIYVGDVESERAVIRIECFTVASALKERNATVVPGLPIIGVAGQSTVKSR